MDECKNKLKIFQANLKCTTGLREETRKDMRFDGEIIIPRWNYRPTAQDIWKIKKHFNPQSIDLVQSHKTIAGPIEENILTFYGRREEGQRHQFIVAH